MTKVFVTSNGDKIRGRRLSEAFNKVADFWVSNARAIRAKDNYAEHVSESDKDVFLERQLEQAERIRTGNEPMGFWLWQRINTELTGHCIAFFAAPLDKVR